MDVIERHIPADCIRNPEDLVKTLQMFCKRNSFEMESLEMRNDAYIIRARPIFVHKLESFSRLEGKRSAKQVFLTLIYSDAIEYIRDLQEANFTDGDLPVRKRRSRTAPGKTSIYRSRVNDTSPYTKTSLSGFQKWTEVKLDNFLHKQWIFLAPVLAEHKFAHVFHLSSPLPYVPTEGSDRSSEAGYFGAVKKRGLHNGHHAYRTLSEDEETEGCIEVAVKKLTIQGSAATDVDKFYSKETETLDKMRELDHDHLIKAVAAYKKGPDRCFVFPWAQGGSLRDLWRSYRAILNEDLVSWAVNQMIGLCDGLRELHIKHIRHGDLKPDNILCFMSGNDSPHQRTLVLADVGLAKYHAEYTRDRTKVTTTKHGSRIYEPPEMSVNGGQIKVSRNYDTWSLGCVFLEFTIWLLYGQDGRTSFRQKLLNNPDIDRFWKNDIDQSPQIHPVAREWLDKILTKDLQGVSALRDLVLWIDEQLLVPGSGQRATAEGVFSELDRIRSKSSSNRRYLFNSELKELAKHRDGSNFVAADDRPHPSREYVTGKSKLNESNII
ncbi:hypothetical protein CEP54_008830 [Fusarium duplospermum]|uniref:Protein kinase domain-containing protein n=1 Tax=Fusarium duplospermum TaxID=1325734 RepID=A0A428PTR1_9HYPO|nr:hypothetical protein CEP54_008830 [Fusarium duplospermum]